VYNPYSFNLLSDAYLAAGCILLTFILGVLVVSAFLPREKRKGLRDYLSSRMEPDGLKSCNSETGTPPPIRSLEARGS
jgi:hypothetical protein